MVESENKRGRKWVRVTAIVARTLMGLLFVLTGLNIFLDFLPKPPPEELPAFARAMADTHYMMPLVGGTQLLAGLLLLSGLLVPLALVLIAPVVVNIVAFHFFLAPSGNIMALIVLALELFLVWAYRGAFRPLFTPRATPDAG